MGGNGIGREKGNWAEIKGKLGRFKIRGCIGGECEYVTQCDAIHQCDTSSD